MALNGLCCADVPLSKLTDSLTFFGSISSIWQFSFRFGSNHKR